MDINYRQLKSHLNQPCLQAYWLSSDDVFLQFHTQQLLINQAKKQDYAIERCQLMNASDWSALTQTCAIKQLFSDKRFILVDATTQKINQKFSQQWLNLTTQHPQDISFCLSTKRMLSAQKKTKWCTAMLETHAHIAIWPLDAQSYPNWLQTQLSHLRLNLTQKATHTLQEITQLNPRISINILNKLALVFDQTDQITAEHVRTLCSEIQDTSIFDVTNAALLGHSKQCLECLNQLPKQPATLMTLWGLLSQTLLLLIKAQSAIDQGQSLTTSVRQHARSQAEQQRFTSILKRHNTGQLHHLLGETWVLETSIKGLRPEISPWLQLKQLLLNISQPNMGR